MKEPLLEVKKLKTVFETREGELVAVDGIDFVIFPGEILGLIGESGSGKTISGLSILNLIPNPGKIAKGDILFKGRSLPKLSEKEMREIRGREIAYIFQDPTTSLNPTKTVGWQISHILEMKLKNQKADLKGERNPLSLKEKTQQLLVDVGILSPEKVTNLYPHSLSGGMLQRILIAMALGCSPDLIIADEPTTNLDVIVEAQILHLFLRLRDTVGSAILFITHDIGVIAETCDRVIVLYAGKILEKGGISDVLNHPLHPYTVGLLNSSPKLEEERECLYQIKGELPSLLDLPKGCRFHPRCDRSHDLCRHIPPDMVEVREHHFVSCHLYP
jgi:peptide/nickel transport system ATP-binding protein/oligopeptide transport system ATP-binding protein